MAFSRPARKNKEKRVIGARKSVADVVASLREKHGAESIMMFSSGAMQNVPVISTRSFKIDKALGIGGLPRGRIVEVYGPESSGKTTLCLQIIAEAQAQGMNAAFIDAENALDLTYARALGVNVDDLAFSQPDSGEDALNLTEDLVNSGSIDIIVVDSVATLVPRAELSGNMGDSHVGLQARLMSQALRKLTASVRKTNCLLIFTNQLRMKIGVMWGSPETTSGGGALKYYASVRLDIRTCGKLKKGGTEAADDGKDDPENTIGNKVRVKVVKNKMAPPYRIAETVIVYGKGIDTTRELIDYCMENDIFTKKGSWYSYGDQQLGQGYEAVVTLLDENQEFKEQLIQFVKDKEGEEQEIEPESEKDRLTAKLAKLEEKLQGSDGEQATDLKLQKQIKIIKKKLAKLE